MLPRPLAFLAALALSGTTGVAVGLLPGRAQPDAGPRSAPVAGAGGGAGADTPTGRPPGTDAAPGATPGATPGGPGTGEGPAFVAFLDATRTPVLGLAAHARRTGLRRYAVGHVIAEPGGCVPRWAGPAAGGTAVAFGDLRGPFADLRAGGGQAGLVLGGPAGRGLAGACATVDDLAAAYRSLVTATGAAFLDFEVRDGGDHVAAERRARAVRALQEALPVRVGFTLELHPDGLAEQDVELLRLTRRLGVDVTTVNLLAPVEARGRHTPYPVREVAALWEPRPETGASDGRLGRVASAVRAARDQVAEAQGLTGAREAGRRIALTPVLDGPDGLSEADARRLSAFAGRHGLAWLSLRGPAQDPAVARILWRTPA
ncbi:hypothetical protein ACGF0J_32855 [Nonomuraea sp. NPDC047897]|uniref:hypothetical protein n=1 Tax=Nonomuraea sp. NPDC047897 TaxID=3364346 RepID=UPI0037122445